MQQVTYKGSSAGLRSILANLPLILSGRAPDPFGVAQAVQLRVGVALLSQIQQDFLTKSRGGTGKDGVQWKPLKRETIAARRTTKAELKSLGAGGKRVRGLLTPAEDKLWRAIYARNLAKLRHHLGEAAARAKSAQIAWAELKRRGAKTRLDVLGGRVVDIGRDTGRMFRSFTPGVEDQPSNETEQVFDTPSGAVIVGSNVPYFPRFHNARPCWPQDGTIPPAWEPALIAAAGRGMIRAVEILARHGGG